MHSATSHNKEMIKFIAPKFVIENIKDYFLIIYKFRK